MKLHWLTREVLLGNWQMRLGALGLALVMWAWVRQESTITMRMTVPLELKSPPRTMRLVQRPPASVVIRIQVPRPVAGEISPGSVFVVADLSYARGRKVSISLTAADVHRPAGVNVLDISPSQIELEFEPRGRN